MTSVSPEGPDAEQLDAALLRQFRRVMENPVAAANVGAGLANAVPKNVKLALPLTQGAAEPRKDGLPVAAV